jgi:adenosylcobinamide kinase/adenosylcobinamide-phosphate guanylyltransferase
MPEPIDADAADAALNAEIEALLAAYEASDAEWIIVSNEVGLGLVPVYPLGRVYRDALGRANQRLAAAADRVLFLVAGLPLTVK